MWAMFLFSLHTLANVYFGFLAECSVKPDNFLSQSAIYKVNS